MNRLLLVPLFTVTACASVHGFKEKDLERWYVPVESSARARTTFEHVSFLESEPKERKSRVIGLIAPPDGEFDSYAETINAVRATASLFGADAVYVESEAGSESWRFRADAGGASGGGRQKISIRARAIVWE
jgi:hypothetical protein